MINGVKGENRLSRHICIIAERARHVGSCGSRSFYPLHGCEFLLLRNLSAKKISNWEWISPDTCACRSLLVMSALAEQAVIVRKYRPVFWDLPQLHVKIFNGIHGVNQPSYRLLYIRLYLQFCPHSGHCKDLFFNIPAYWCCVFSDALRFKFGFSGSRNGRFHFATLVLTVFTPWPFRLLSVSLFR